MELQLGLSLPTHNFVASFDLNSNKGSEPREMMDLKAWSIDNGCLDNKRCFDEAFGKIKDESQTLPLVLWCGQPNDDDDDWKGEKSIFCDTMNKNDEQEKHVAGWPPIKSWRKKLLHQHQGGHIVTNIRTTAGNANNGSNSRYVKVKMEGVAITRKIDLRLYHSYETLTNSLISMFSECQKLEEDAARYTLTYQDRDGDWLIAGDLPWQTFIGSVQRLELVKNGG